MDSNGDRETDFSLWDMDPNTGAFRVRLCPPRRQCQLGVTSHLPTSLHKSEPWIKAFQPIWRNNQSDRDSGVVLGEPHV